MAPVEGRNVRTNTMFSAILAVLFAIDCKFNDTLLLSAPDSVLLVSKSPFQADTPTTTSPNGRYTKTETDIVQKRYLC